MKPPKNKFLQPAGTIAELRPCVALGKDSPRLTNTLWKRMTYPWCSGAVMCMYCRFIYWNNTAVFIYAICVARAFSKGIVYTWRRGQVFMLMVRLPSLPHHHTTNKTHIGLSSILSAERHRAIYIYISIRRGLTTFNSTSLRQSFSGCATHDRLCTAYEPWIMQKIHKH